MYTRTRMQIQHPLIKRALNSFSVKTRPVSNAIMNIDRMTGERSHESLGTYEER